MTRVVVTGGRDFTDEARVWNALSEIMPAHVAQGGAAGADAGARSWCRANAVPCTTYEADWHKDGPAAGPLRNQEMLESFKPDLVLAFPGGRGTADCVRKAKRLGVNVLEFPPAETT